MLGVLTICNNGTKIELSKRWVEFVDGRRHCCHQERDHCRRDDHL